MATIAIRVVGAILALLGLLVGAVGLWFVVHLGSSGTATFAGSPSGSGPVVVTPALLNRLVVPTKVTATPSRGGELWIGVAAPSDATAVLGAGARSEATRVSVTDWSVALRHTGSGTSARLHDAEMWRNKVDGRGPVTVTIDQRSAPETVVVVPTSGSVRSITLQWREKAWFVKGLVAALIGLSIFIIGLLALRASFGMGRSSGRHAKAPEPRRRGAVVPPTAEPTADATASPTDRAADGVPGSADADAREDAETTALPARARGGDEPDTTIIPRAAGEPSEAAEDGGTPERPEQSEQPEVRR